MNTAEKLTQLENENRDLERALRNALHGTPREREEAEAILIQRGLSAQPGQRATFFDLAVSICADPFRKPTFH